MCVCACVRPDSEQLFSIKFKALAQAPFSCILLVWINRQAVFQEQQKRNKRTSALGF